MCTDRIDSLSFRYYSLQYRFFLHVFAHFCHPFQSILNVRCFQVWVSTLLRSCLDVDNMWRAQNLAPCSFPNAQKRIDHSGSFWLISLVCSWNPMEWERALLTSTQFLLFFQVHVQFNNIRKIKEGWSSRAHFSSLSRISPSSTWSADSQNRTSNTILSMPKNMNKRLWEMS